MDRPYQHPRILIFTGCFYGSPKISDETFVFALPGFFVRLSKQRRWVNRGKNSWRKLRRQHFAALASNAKRRTKDGLRGGCAETDQQLRLDQAQLRLQPRTAGCDLA